MKHHAFDFTNGSLAVGYLYATFSGWTVSEYAAAAALVYTGVLIIDKIASMVGRWLLWRRKHER